MIERFDIILKESAFDAEEIVDVLQEDLIIIALYSSMVVIKLKSV